MVNNCETPNSLLNVHWCSNVDSQVLRLSVTSVSFYSYYPKGKFVYRERVPCPIFRIHLTGTYVLLSDLRLMHSPSPDILFYSSHPLVRFRRRLSDSVSVPSLYEKLGFVLFLQTKISLSCSESFHEELENRRKFSTSVNGPLEGVCFSSTGSWR